MLTARAETEAGQRLRTHRLLAYDLLFPAGLLHPPRCYETVGVVDKCPAGSAARWYRKRL